MLLVRNNNKVYEGMDAAKSIVSTALCDEVVEIIDRSKGCDQNVFLVSTKKGEKCIIKMPRKAKRPPMHSPVHQAEVIQKMRELGLAVPDVIEVTQEYLIEKCVGEWDWGEKANEFTPAQTRDILQQLGKITRGMHQIRTSGFGEMSQTVFIGEDTRGDGWLQTRKKEYFPNLEDAAEKLSLTSRQQDVLKKFFYQHEEYLRNFRDSRFLHADITPNNVRLTENLQVYLIDYADGMCGDPLYDIGRVLVELKGDWELVKEFLVGYQLELTEDIREKIRFYAVAFELWLCEDNKLLYKLMAME